MNAIEKRGPILTVRHICRLDWDGEVWQVGLRVRQGREWSSVYYYAGQPDETADECVRNALQKLALAGV